MEVINNGVCVNKRDYRGQIKQVCVNNSWAAVLCDGSVQLHSIEQEGEDIQFKSQGTVIQCIAMTSQFLIYVDSTSKLVYYMISERQVVKEYRFETQIAQIHPNNEATRLVAVDITGAGVMYNPVNDNSLMVPNFSSKCKGVIWDLNDHNFFISVEPGQVLGYLYSPVTLYGPIVESVRELLSVEDLKNELRESVTIVEKGHKPLLVCNGILFCHSETQGTIRGNFLSSHSSLTQWRGRSDTSEGHYRYFLQNLVLRRFKQCYLVAQHLGGSKIPEVLGNLALQSLDLETAERAYQLAQNVGMVYAIRSVMHENEKQVLLGNVALILQQYDLAQDCFLKSTQPGLALMMRSDLQDWFIAVKLARSIDPSQEPILSKKLAQQLETKGEFQDALRLFERAVGSINQSNLSQQEANNEVIQCYAGIARTSIRCGDITRGFKIASELSDAALRVDCALVCEQMKHFSEAAELYHKAGQPEKAASLYIKLKRWREASELMDRITTPKLLIQLGKAKETEGSYKEAEAAYEKAHDYENVIRVNLQHLNNPNRAKQIIRQYCPTQAAAQMMADHLEGKGARNEAVEFLVMAGKREDAFVMAQSYDLMETYADYLIKSEEKAPEEHMRIAQFFEGRNKMGHAARHYEHANQAKRALQLFIQSGEEWYAEAIKMVGRSKNDALTMQLYDYFIGEIDGIPKDPKYIYMLYMAQGKLKEAANAAIIIASEEQESGNYKAAHTRLFETIRDMRNQRLAIPYIMQQKLMILHSYALVKQFIRMNDHLQAARMLIRVAKNISQFPAHAVQILTSTVIECTRSGLKEAAYNWACVLVRPEYRSQLEEKFKKQIERVAIKRPKVEDIEEDRTPCPHCQAYLYESELYCENCQNNLPFCIASGKHMLINEWAHCPMCKFPGNLNNFSSVLEKDPVCPMCEASLPLSRLTLVPDPLSELRSLATVKEEETR